MQNFFSNITRDDLKWTFGIIGGLAIAFAANLQMFSYFPLSLQHAIEIAAFIFAVISGKLATSPLPGKKD